MPTCVAAGWADAAVLPLRTHQRRRVRQARLEVHRRNSVPSPDGNTSTPPLAVHQCARLAPALQTASPPRHRQRATAARWNGRSNIEHIPNRTITKHGTQMVPKTCSRPPPALHGGTHRSTLHCTCAPAPHLHGCTPIGSGGFQRAQRRAVNKASAQVAPWVFQKGTSAEGGSSLRSLATPCGGLQGGSILFIVSRTAGVCTLGARVTPISAPQTCTGQLFSLLLPPCGAGTRKGSLLALFPSREARERLETERFLASQDLASASAPKSCIRNKGVRRQESKASGSIQSVCVLLTCTKRVGLRTAAAPAAHSRAE